MHLTSTSIALIGTLIAALAALVSVVVSTLMQRALKVAEVKDVVFAEFLGSIHTLVVVGIERDTLGYEAWVDQVRASHVASSRVELVCDSRTDAAAQRLLQTVLRCDLVNVAWAEIQPLYDGCVNEMRRELKRDTLPPTSQYLPGTP